MDEILYELREHSAGLNCGRWDYIFSFIKTLRSDPSYVMPDRDQVTMEQPCMRAYTQLAVKTCHRRHAHAIGGMAAQIPVKSDSERNRRALEKVVADKQREARDGHDGTWVAHPGLVALAREVFDAAMPGPNQLERQRDDVHVGAAELLERPKGTATLRGLRHNIDVGIQYLASWLDGSGCVPLYDLMEDAATAEISRTQVWQWLRHSARLDGEVLTRERLVQTIDEQLEALRDRVGPGRFAEGHYETARRLFERLSVAEVCADFLTLSAYEELLAKESVLK
jgi:malate synthase